MRTGSYTAVYVDRDNKLRTSSPLIRKPKSRGGADPSDALIAHLRAAKLNRMVPARNTSNTDVHSERVDVDSFGPPLGIQGENVDTPVE